MKKILFLMLMLICLTAKAQDTIPNTKSKTVELMEKEGILLKKDFYDIGKVGNIPFQTIIVTNISTGEKTGALRITTTYSSVNYIGTLDYDELTGCISSLEYIKNNILPNTYDNYIECEYKTRDGGVLGVYCRDSNINKYDKVWGLYIQTKRYTDNSFVSMKVNRIDDIIACFKKAKSNLEDNLRHN